MLVVSKLEKGLKLNFLQDKKQTRMASILQWRGDVINKL